MMRGTTGHPPAHSKLDKTKSLTLHTHDCLVAIADGTTLQSLLAVLIQTYIQTYIHAMKAYIMISLMSEL